MISPVIIVFPPEPMKPIWEERQVTIEGETHRLSVPFLVLHD
ncbi:MAG: hypothetical protein ABSA11_14365 [Candidatus Bathyarchaeia archaeon]